MTIEDIIVCMNVVGHHNPSMMSLHDSLLAQSAIMGDSNDAVAAADAAGDSIYRALATVQVELANALHDYTYNVIHPFDSVTVKNVIREQICREVFGLEANF